jgi:hypothetical protein
MRLAGKAYVMDGDDSQKLSLLHQLAATDFLSAKWEKVPERFTVVHPDGTKISGVFRASLLNDTFHQSQIFAELIETLARELPTDLQREEEGYKGFRMEMLADPLVVTTVVVKMDDGQLIPMISNQ